MAFDRPDEFEIVQLNDLAAAESSAYLIQFDSVHGEHAAEATIPECAMCAQDEPLPGVPTPVSCILQQQQQQRGRSQPRCGQGPRVLTGLIRVTSGALVPSA